MTIQHINTFDKTNSNQILDDLRELLDAYAATRGISAGKLRGTISPVGDGLKVSIELATVTGDGKVNTPEMRAWKEQCQYEWSELRRAGLTEDDLGATFTVRGEQFTIEGFKPRARKRPVLAQKVGSGALFVFPIDAVARLLGKQVQNSKALPFNN